MLLPEFAELPSEFKAFMLKVLGGVPDVSFIGSFCLSDEFFYWCWLWLSFKERNIVSISSFQKSHKVVKEGKSNQSVLAKEAFHKFLHASQGTEMEVNFSKRKVK